MFGKTTQDRQEMWQLLKYCKSFFPAEIQFKVLTNKYFELNPNYYYFLTLTGLEVLR